MGQAESTTLTKRAAVTTAKIASQCDEKIEVSKILRTAHSRFFRTTKKNTRRIFLRR